jgi:hypothetical protein
VLTLRQTLARALRVRDLKDMFSATRHILQTVARDPNTEHVRSIKPDEKVESMWDSLGKTSKAFVRDPAGGEMVEAFAQSYFYTEADKLEDALLFPQEANGDMVDNLFRNDPSAMEIFEKGTIDIRKFADDLDTDEELMGEEDYEDETDSELDEEELAALEDDDGDSEWGTDDDEASIGGAQFITAEEQDAIDDTINICSAQMKRSSAPDYFLPILRNPAGARGIPEAVKRDPSNLMHALRNAMRCLKEYDGGDMGMHADFMRHLDRQKSKGNLLLSGELEVQRLIQS